jgi:hypothetical protein
VPVTGAAGSGPVLRAAGFTNHGTAIISNQEENETIVKIAYPSGTASARR